MSRVLANILFNHFQKNREKTLNICMDNYHNHHYTMYLDLSELDKSIISQLIEYDQQYNPSIRKEIFLEALEDLTRYGYITRSDHFEDGSKHQHYDLTPTSDRVRFDQFKTFFDLVDEVLYRQVMNNVESTVHNSVVLAIENSPEYNQFVQRLSKEGILTRNQNNPNLFNGINLGLIRGLSYREAINTLRQPNIQMTTYNTFDDNSQYSTGDNSPNIKDSKIKKSAVGVDKVKVIQPKNKPNWLMRFIKALSSIIMVLITYIDSF